MTRCFCFMFGRRDIWFTLYYVFSSTLQQTKNSFGALSKNSWRTTKYQRQNTLSQCTRLFVHALHEKLDQIFTWQSPQNHNEYSVFWVWPAINHTFLWHHLSEQSPTKWNVHIWLSSSCYLWVLTVWIFDSL